MKILEATRMLWLVSFFFISVCAKEEDPELVRYDDGRLSVEFSSLELGTALDMISAKTGITFSFKPDMQDSLINQRFDDLPLDNAIKRLLKDFNYVMLYDESARSRGRIGKIILMSKIEKNDIDDRMRLAREEAVPASPDPPPENAQIIIKQNGSGHYLAAGKINSHPVEFIVDTGATLVAVPGALAREMRLARGQQRTVYTANGHTKGFSTTLESIELQGLTKTGVPAIILTNMKTDNRVLLGMSFLRHFDLVTRNDKLTIQPRIGAR
jgi:aspartyl protease family protein